MRKTIFLFSSGKTKSLLSQCKPTKMDNAVASCTTKRISENFCTRSNLHGSFGQNEDKTFSNQTVTPSLLQRTRLTAAGGLVATHKSTLKFSGNRSPQLTNLILQDLELGERGADLQQPAGLTMQQTAPEPCPAPWQLPSAAHGLASTLAFV